MSAWQKSLSRWYRLYVGDTVKYWRRQVRRGLRSPMTAIRFHTFKQAIKRRDWPAAQGLLEPLATAAQAGRDRLLLKEIAFSAHQLGEYEKATAWELATARMEGGIAAGDWLGEPLDDAKLVVRFMEKEGQGLAGGLNVTGHLRQAAASARECELVVEKRMVPIYARSLPAIKVSAFPAKFDGGGGRVATANPLLLKAAVGTTPERIERLFHPLKADAELTAQLRRRYQSDHNRPLIGLSWWSSHHGKDSPAIEQWAELTGSIDATFVSVQYSETAADLDILRQAAGQRFIVDESVDQMIDMDRFAAQLAALDGLVTISNTGAHLAGAMGLRTWLLRDDRFRRAWPVQSDRLPWYPETRVLGKDGREWEAVMDDLKSEIRAAYPGCR